MKRYFILILAAVLILSCLVGCRKKDNNVSTDPNGMIENVKPSTQRPSTENTQRPSTESTQHSTTESTDSSQPDSSSDETESDSSSDGSEPDSTQEDVVGRARRTRPLFR